MKIMYFLRKLRSGLGLLLLYVVGIGVLMGIGLFTFTQLAEISSTVHTLTGELADERDVIQQIPSQILQIQIRVDEYITTQQQEDLDKVNEAFLAFEQDLKTALGTSRSTLRVQQLDAIESALGAYKQTFGTITGIIQERQRLYDRDMDEAAQSMMAKFVALRVHVAFLQDPTAFLAFSNAQSEFYEMVNVTSCYMRQGDERYAVTFEFAYTALLAALDELDVVLQDSIQRENVKGIRGAAHNYYNGFRAIQSGFIKLNTSLISELWAQEQYVQQQVETITLDFTQEYSLQNKQSQKFIQRTRITFLVTMLIAVAVGIGLGGVLLYYINAQQAAEKILRQSEQRYRSLFEGTPVGLYRSTPDGRIIAINPALIEMLKYPDRKTALNARVLDIYVNPEDRWAWQQRIASEGVVRDFETELRRYDGELVLVKDNARAITDVDDQICYYEGSIEDITAQVAAQAELTRYREHLESLVTARTTELNAAKLAAEKAKLAAEQANRAKSIFLANMSHELRTPLNAIIGFSELLLFSTLNEEQLRNLETIQRSGEHLLAMINDVLDLSKIEAGRVELSSQPFDIHQMAYDVVEMFRLRATEQGLTLNIQCGYDIPQFIQTDDRKLRQVLINLLSNAVKFTDAGTVILRVTSLSDPLRLHFEVVDTGIGIAEEELPNVFVAFEQTSSGQESRQGTGLGMAISHEYVRLMGGELTVSSTVGMGSCFQFTIPVEAVDHISVPSPSETIRALRIAPDGRGGTPGPYRILIADDMPEACVLLQEILKPLGFEVKVVGDGVQALAMSATWQPHLIFMDMRMPVMDGREATKRIKATSSGTQKAADKESTNTEPPISSRHVPIIIALTASAFNENVEEMLALGCDGFVRKPFYEKDILAMLEHHLGVTFIYADTQTACSPSLELTSEDHLRAVLATLPGQWRRTLHQATLEGDIIQMEALIAQVQDVHPACARQLSEMVYNFEHDALLTLTRADVG